MRHCNAMPVQVLPQSSAGTLSTQCSIRIFLQTMLKNGYRNRWHFSECTAVCPRTVRSSNHVGYAAPWHHSVQGGMQAAAEESAHVAQQQHGVQKSWAIMTESYNEGTGTEHFEMDWEDLQPSM